MYVYILVSCFLILGVMGYGSVGISLAGRVIYSCVCVTPLCRVPGWYDFIQVLCWGGWRDCTDFFLFSGSVVAGMVRLKW
jgi:hypothetical protein